VQASVADEEVLLTYFAGSDRLHIFAVTATSIGHVSQPLGAGDLTARVRLVRELVERRSEELTPALTALHRQLILAPLLVVPDPQRVRRLVLVTDGALTHLPFAALQDGRTGRYLVESYVLVNAPSASWLPREVSMTGGPGDGAVFAPFPDDLPATATEARAIEREQPGATAYLGEEATEAALRRSLQRDAFVHVATHGTLIPDSPLFSRIELADDGPNNGHESDGQLEVHEIAALPIRSDLVFLSGCETGIGSAGATTFSTGEDYATLTRALHTAGARSVVATLWRIEDESASRFASGFYRFLKVGDPAQALAWSQRRMIRRGTDRAPFFWAPYRVSGNARSGTDR
jgi:CHAT domain-containing protein